MPLGDMITIAQFAFCEEHGLEFCTRCFCDYRMMNNVLVEEYVEQYSDEDMRIEALEALGDDRPSLSILRVGEPSKAVNSKGVRIYRCFQHRTRDCNVCFAFVRYLLEHVGMYQDLDDQASAKKRR
ncbi:hypothetical protein BKA62DRAFT_658385 [Auriculariales sp. MPI-PUGE-AT-0066]|nr:hypothetical protein BKA62DRAFT_658385 [Auriculariales sp. MPI-PUGE-AT-0066]